MKALKLKSSTKENPVWGHMYYTEPDEIRGGSEPEGIMKCDENYYCPTLFSDFYNSIHIINDLYGKEAYKWELVNIKITIE